MNSNSLNELQYQFRTMRIPHQILLDAHDHFDRLRYLRRKALESGRAGIEAGCIVMFAPSQAGKSVILKSYMERRVVQDCLAAGLFAEGTPPEVIIKAQRLVVRISLTGTSTLKSLLGDILRAYGDPRPEYGSIDNMRYRVVNYIESFRTELLMFDEMNHLRVEAVSRDHKYQASRVHNTLKDLLLEGFPIVFTGNEEAEIKVLSDEQIDQRVVKRIQIGPLSPKKRKDREVFADYCGYLGLRLSEQGLFPERSNFLHGDVVSCLFRASGGLLGRVSRIVEKAAVYAIEAGEDSITREHLADATDDYLRRGPNPFRNSRGPSHH